MAASSSWHSRWYARFVMSARCSASAPRRFGFGADVDVEVEAEGGGAGLRTGSRPSAEPPALMARCSAARSWATVSESSLSSSLSPSPSPSPSPLPPPLLGMGNVRDAGCGPAPIASRSAARSRATVSSSTSESSESDIREARRLVDGACRTGASKVKLSLGRNTRTRNPVPRWSGVPPRPLASAPSAATSTRVPPASTPLSSAALPLRVLPVVVSLVVAHRRPPALPS
eukprot:scaffold36127_cov36-Phaeocystis_antarctica.AAC.1